MDYFTPYGSLTKGVIFSQRKMLTEWQRELEALAREFPILQDYTLQSFTSYF